MFHVLVDDFKVVTKRNLSRTNISEFVMSHTKIPTGANGWVADNAATRFLAGGPQEGPLSRADLMRAIKNMDKMEVGATSMSLRAVLGEAAAHYGTHTQAVITAIVFATVGLLCKHCSDIAHHSAQCTLPCVS
jgi:hypothetical protein